ncbi:hypothetical protein CLOM_g4906 [Closterium sp. NIES-68]|nr:hypothetical protein CLOM_g4906 [Closterium sp. NIES-68]
MTLTGRRWRNGLMRPVLKHGPRRPTRLRANGLETTMATVKATREKAASCCPHHGPPRGPRRPGCVE